jgi:hypothetical protein
MGLGAPVGPYPGQREAVGPPQAVNAPVSKALTLQITCTEVQVVFLVVLKTWACSSTLPSFSYFSESLHSNSSRL